MRKGWDQAKVLTSEGDSFTISIERPNEYKPYIDATMEFYQWAFSTPEQRQQIEMTTKHESEMIDKELA